MLYDFAMWVGVNVVLLLLWGAEVIRAAWEWVGTGPGLLTLGALVAVVWSAVLYGLIGNRRRRRRAAAGADEKGTTTA